MKDSYSPSTVEDPICQQAPAPSIGGEVHGLADPCGSTTETVRPTKSWRTQRRRSLGWCARKIKGRLYRISDTSLDRPNMLAELSSHEDKSYECVRSTEADPCLKAMGENKIQYADGNVVERDQENRSRHVLGSATSARSAIPQGYRRAWTSFPHGSSL